MVRERDRAHPLRRRGHWPAYPLLPRKPYLELSLPRHHPTASRPFSLRRARLFWLRPFRSTGRLSLHSRRARAGDGGAGGSPRTGKPHRHGPGLGWANRPGRRAPRAGADPRPDFRQHLVLAYRPAANEALLESDVERADAAENPEKQFLRRKTDPG